MDYLGKTCNQRLAVSEAIVIIDGYCRLMTIVIRDWPMGTIVITDW